MKCPDCGAEFVNFVSKCPKCHYFFVKSDFQCYIDEYISKYDGVINKCPKFPSDSGEIIFKNINLEYEFNPEDDSIVEDLVINYYNEKGFNAFFAENRYWIALFLLFFYSGLNLEYINMFNFVEYINDYNEYVDYDKLANSDLINMVMDSYFMFLARGIGVGETKYDNLINYFSLDELLVAPIYLNHKQLSLIFERLGSDFDFFSRGFPDLIVYDDDSLFFVEVKSKMDSPSFNQIQWHKFLSEVVNVDVVIFSINKSDRQIDFMKKMYDVDLIDYNERNSFENSVLSSGKILIKPDEYIGFYGRHCYIYVINHSSGKKPPKELLEIHYPSNKKSKKYREKRYGDESEFMMLMRDYKNNFEKGTRIHGKFSFFVFTLERNQRRDYLESLSKMNDDILYEKAKKLFYPNVFADYRPTKKQLRRNREAKLFEAKGDYDKARELYEENVSENTGSSIPYKQLIKFYVKSNDYYRVIEIMNIAIPIFLYLGDKNNVLYFLNVKYDAMLKSHYSKHNKYISVEENDYLYENCCKDSVKKELEELFDKWRKEEHSFLKNI